VAGNSIVVYDIIVIENGTVTVITGKVPLLSVNVTVAPGPAVIFYLSNYKSVTESNASRSFSKLENVTMVTFQDAGKNVHSPFYLLDFCCEICFKALDRWWMSKMLLFPSMHPQCTFLPTTRAASPIQSKFFCLS
jgi:hypothetical protein